MDMDMDITPRNPYLTYCHPYMQPTNKSFYKSYPEKRSVSIQKTKKNQTLKPLEVENNSPADQERQHPSKP